MHSESGLEYCHSRILRKMTTWEVPGCGHLTELFLKATFLRTGNNHGNCVLDNKISIEDECV